MAKVSDRKALCDRSETYGICTSRPRWLGPIPPTPRGRSGNLAAADDFCRWSRTFTLVLGG